MRRAEYPGRRAAAQACSGPRAFYFNASLASRIFGDYPHVRVRSLLDLKRQYAPLRLEIEDRVRAIMDSQQFILGPAVESFEEDVRRFCAAGCAVGMSSGTDAQLAALMALEIGPGDAVITTPYTFFATAGCISRVGARPVFADIEADTFNLSPAALAHYLGNVARRDSARILRTPTGERLRAIIPVHLFGLCCDMDGILRLGREYELPGARRRFPGAGRGVLPGRNRPAAAGGRHG